MDAETGPAAPQVTSPNPSPVVDRILLDFEKGL
jgi:hypothetical protein